MEGVTCILNDVLDLTLKEFAHKYTRLTPEEFKKALFLQIVPCERCLACDPLRRPRVSRFSKECQEAICIKRVGGK